MDWVIGILKIDYGSLYIDHNIYKTDDVIILINAHISVIIH